MTVSANAPLLSVEGLSVIYDLKGGKKLRAVDNANFTVGPGEIVGLVGESGSGKSTLARAILGITPRASGTVWFDECDLTVVSPQAMRDKRRDMQFVFQDPLDSLNPRLTIGQSVAEPLQCASHRVTQKDVEKKVREALDTVGLPQNAFHRRPHEFSGGQRQRIAIARAIITRPKILFCDEAVSALDVSVQAQIINLLQQLRDDIGMSIVFISHDMAVVRHLCPKIMVMYYGRIVESGQREELFAEPLHPYTKALIDAVPRISRKHLPPPAPMVDDNPANATNVCNYAPRCAKAFHKCQEEKPQFKKISSHSHVACWLHDATQTS